LREDLELALDWELLRTAGPDSRPLKALCIECGFHRFLTELPAEEDQPEPEWKADYRVVDTPEKLQEFVAELARQPRFCARTETTPVDPLRADLVGLAFSWQEGVAYYLPVRGPMFDKVLDQEKTLEALRPILADAAVEKVGQNLKYDMLVLGKLGAEI